MPNASEKGHSLVELRNVGPDLIGPLTRFFETECNDAHFHPHPFTASQAAKICDYGGADIYAVALKEGAVQAYGMLRGWDEGYAIPSLGIIVAREARRTGLAHLVMKYLHYNARVRGASAVRLKVYPDNLVALSLYRKLGYQFGDAVENGQLVGLCALGGSH